MSERFKLGFELDRTWPKSCLTMNRRRVLAGACLSMFLGQANAEEPDGTLPAFSPKRGRVPDLEHLGPVSPPGTTAGTNAPGNQAIGIAKTIAKAAPRNARPVDVALYYHRIATKIDRPNGVDRSIYTEEWGTTYNPLIVTFFNATETRTPVGDCTPWCSAFVNWCIERGQEDRQDGRVLRSTHNASSRSFRNWGAHTSVPKFGDVVVFERGSNCSQGHVGFFVAETSTEVYVLGGNQSACKHQDSNCPPDLAGGRISVIKIVKTKPGLFLLSYRTDASLHDRPALYTVEMGSVINGACT